MGSFLLSAFAALGIQLAGAHPPQFDQLPVQIKIRHADPWLIAALLNGENPLSPEMSVTYGLPGFGGGPGGGQGGGQQGQNRGGGQSLIKGGRIIINPADNSIWFIPDKP